MTDHLIRSRAKVVVALALAVALTGCAASQATPTVPSLSGGPGAPQSQADALHRAGQCIRQHGIPGFPDPSVNAAGQVTFDKTQLITVSRAVVVHAVTACRTALDRAGILSGRGHGHGGSAPTPQQLHHLLAFAQCMRAHGVPGMADPNPVNGQISLPPGISKDSPVLQRALQACRSALSGNG